MCKPVQNERFYECTLTLVIKFNILSGGTWNTIRQVKKRKYYGSSGRQVLPYDFRMTYQKIWTRRRDATRGLVKI